MLRCEWKHRKYSVFWRWLKKHSKLQCFWPPDPQKHGICSVFCFSPRKNTVNNSIYAVFFIFFVIFWTALVRYTWLSNSSCFFFSDNQYFRMFLVSVADIIGSYERLPNDAVGVVAVAKRREYSRGSKSCCLVTIRVKLSWVGVIPNIVS